MVHSGKEVLNWLLEHCQHDRVLYNALTNHQSGPIVEWAPGGGRWYVLVTCRSGLVLDIAVVPHSVTGEPHHYYRFISEVRAINEKD